MTFNGYYTLMAAVLVLGLGHFLVARIAFLRNFNIPEPVAGGLLVALVLWGVHEFGGGMQLKFDSSLQSAFMLAFFSSVGLSADFARLKAGGRPLITFLLVVSVFVVVQNAVGVGLASALGQDPLLGLIAGSITLVGGHGTAGAWGAVLEKDHGLQGAITLGMACATFGLVLGGLIGGPVARWLIRTSGTPGKGAAEQEDVAAAGSDIMFENPERVRLITTNSGLRTLAMFAFCLAFSDVMFRLMSGSKFTLPQFIWALGGGVVLRAVLTSVFKVNMFDRAIDVFGNISLSIYLAIAMQSLRLWELVDVAGPIAIILTVQVITIVLYVGFVTFRFMGKDYDAAVLCAGQCGFGLGATPTAVANMQAITNHFGPSHKAFLIVPLVGAFFIDLVNATVLQTFVGFLR